MNPSPTYAGRPGLATSSGELQPPAEDPAPIDELSGDVMTVDEAAVFLRIGRNALYDAIGRGDVPHRRIGKTIRLSRFALVRWLGRSCGAASTQGL
jgi:excisionase family DNA binding protein